MKSVQELIREYFEEQKLMQLATVGTDGNPWACSTWQVMDDDMNIYFFSAVNRRHSEEIANDARVAGALAKPHTPADTPRGVQFEGTAQMVDDEQEISHIRKLYEGRIFSAEQIDIFMQHPDRPHKFYKITPKKFVLFDVENFPDDSRQEYAP